MGLFGGGSVIVVSSVVYNLAGDEDKRPNYLRQTVVGDVLGQSSSMGDSIVGSYLNGPGIKFRSFARWADYSGYNNIIGLVTGTVLSGDTLNQTVIATQLPVSPGNKATIQSATIGLANLNIWVDKWLRENRPNKVSDTWSAEYDDATGIVTITYSDKTKDTFTPVGYDQTIRYLYVTYMETGPDQVDPLIPGNTVILGSDDPFPPISGWNVVSTSNIPKSGNLDKVVDTKITYSDGRPDEHTTDTTQTPYSYSETHGVYGRQTNTQIDPNYTSMLVETMYQDQVGNVVTGSPVVETKEETLPDGTKKTTTTTTTTQTLQVTRSYRVDKQTTVVNTYGPQNVFIYGQGQGNAVLDSMFARPTNMGKFYPFVPFRIDNINVDSPQYASLYPWAKKAFKKGSGGKFQDVMDEIKKNPQVGDIDYAYAVYGVALNVKENASRQYIYNFFKVLLDQSPANLGLYEQFKQDWEAATQSLKDYLEWKKTGGFVGWGQPIKPRPEIKPYPNVPGSSIRVSSDNNRVLNYDMTIFWVGISETKINGSIGRKGEYKWDVLPDDTFTMYEISPQDELVPVGGALGPWIGVGTQSISHIRLSRQISDTQYERLDIWGAWHQNMIYKGHSVNTSAKDALADSDESGFIIPLHEAMYRQMTLKDATQMSTASCFLVFNCYVEKKKKWWQSGFFQIIMVVIVVVITYFTWGTGTPFATAAMATGAALGLTGVAALVVGAAVNAIAAMLIMKIIGQVSTMVFGDKLGAVIGAIAGVIAVVMGQQYMTTGSLAGGMAALTSPMSLLSLTSATAKGIGEYQQISAMEMVNNTARLMESYNTQMEEIQRLWGQNIGYANANINPLQLVDPTHDQMYPEKPETFLSRTLLTGSDIAELSHAMISDFASTSLDPSQGIT
ncbi:baseplate wedge protein [Burkholderia phage vB_BpP_HN03]